MGDLLQPFSTPIIYNPEKRGIIYNPVLTIRDRFIPIIYNPYYNYFPIPIIYNPELYIIGMTDRM